MGNLSQDMIPHHINFSSITAEDYNLVYDIIQKVKEEEFGSLGLKSCQIEDELDKVRLLSPECRDYEQMNICKPEILSVGTLHSLSVQCTCELCTCKTWMKKHNCIPAHFRTFGSDVFIYSSLIDNMF